MYMKLKNHWLGRVIESLIVCLICVGIFGPKGILYWIGFEVLHFVAKVFTFLFSGRW